MARTRIAGTFTKAFIINEFTTVKEAIALKERLAHKVKWWCRVFYKSNFKAKA
jgi:hypothetical protein